MRKEDWILDFEIKDKNSTINDLLDLNRLQTEMNVKQHQLSENEKLLQSLRTEIKVYEKLEEARRKRTGIYTVISVPLALATFLSLDIILSEGSRAGSLLFCFCLGLLCKSRHNSLMIKCCFLLGKCSCEVYLCSDSARPGCISPFKEDMAPNRGSMVR